MDVFSAEAWDCEGYNFRVTASGSVQVENRSSNDEPAQEADVFVLGDLIINDAEVPAMKAGMDWTEFEQLPGIPRGNWNWEVIGEKDCRDNGEFEDEEPELTPTLELSNTPAPTVTSVPELTVTPSMEPTDTFTPEPTGTLVPTEEATETLEVTSTPGPSDTPTPKPTEKPEPIKTNTPIVVSTNTPLPPTPTPTSAPIGTAAISMVQTATPTIVACPYTCCPICCGCQVQAQLGVDSEAVDYSDLILEFKPIAYILLGILGANTLLRTYGTFRKD